MTVQDHGASGQHASGTGLAASASDDAAFARNMERQRELYGEPVGERVRRLQAALGVSQARLAKALGLSTAMLSQLASGRRVKMGDPAVVARLLLLERHLQRAGGSEPSRADALLAHVRDSRPNLGLPGPTQQDPGEALRAVAAPAQLAAAANVLGPRFPALAELLRRAATDRR